MAVKKACGWKGGPMSDIVRSPLAPSSPKPQHNPDPTTNRGRRRHSNTEEYQSAYETRKRQSAPAVMSIKRGAQKARARGPAHRRGGMHRDTWVEVMEGKEDHP